MFCIFIFFLNLSSAFGFSSLLSVRLPLLHKVHLQTFLFLVPKFVHATKQYSLLFPVCIGCHLAHLFLKDFIYTVAIFKNTSMLSGRSLIEIFIRLTGLKWFSFQQNSPEYSFKSFFGTTALPVSAWSSIASQDRSKISRQVGSGRIVLGIKMYKSLWGWFFYPRLLLLTTINHAEVHSALLV